MDTAEQAKIRRERRQAKLKAEGSIRLQKITSTQRPPLHGERNDPSATATDEATPLAPPTYSAESAASGRKTEAEIEKQEELPKANDPSEHYYEPRSVAQRKSTLPSKRKQNSNDGSVESETIPLPTKDELHEAMMGFLTNNRGTSNNNNSQPGAEEADPMLEFLQEKGFGNSPDAAGMQQQEAQQRDDKWNSWWKLVHVVCALFLTIFMLRNLGLVGWKGSRVERYRIEVEKSAFDLFYYFAAMELLLQLSRFLIEKGGPPANPVLIMTGSYLPPPFGTFLMMVSRYSEILATAVKDAMIMVFCFGLVALWNSRAVSMGST